MEVYDSSDTQIIYAWFLEANRNKGFLTRPACW